MCLRRFLGSKFVAGVTDVFELTLAIRFLVVICDCKGRAEVDEEGPSWADEAI